MAQQTSIEWTDATWNPVVGCSILSPGCTNCYAMRMAARIEAMDATAGHAPHYRGLTKKTKAGAVWTGTVRLAPEKVLKAPLGWRRPRRVFVNSMSDLFHESLPDSEIDKVFAVMAFATHCTFQVLTKRAERMARYFADREKREGAISAAMNELAPAHWHSREFWDYHDALPMKHIWLGVSAERQQEADARVLFLLDTPAAVRFLSAEPLLGPIDLRWHYINALSSSCGPNLDWVIAGGESGTGARPVHPDWIRDLRDQCAAANVPFFFKQWGNYSPVYDREKDDPDWTRCDQVQRNTPNGQWLNLAGGQGFHGDRVVRMDRVGKTAAGALLDGRKHREWPQ